MPSKTETSKAKRQRKLTERSAPGTKVTTTGTVIEHGMTQIGSTSPDKGHAKREATAVIADVATFRNRFVTWLHPSQGEREAAQLQAQAGKTRMQELFNLLSNAPQAVVNSFFAKNPFNKGESEYQRFVEASAVKRAFDLGEEARKALLADSVTYYVEDSDGKTIAKAGKGYFDRVNAARWLITENRKVSAQRKLYLQAAEAAFNSAKIDPVKLDDMEPEDRAAVTEKINMATAKNLAKLKAEAERKAKQDEAARKALETNAAARATMLLATLTRATTNRRAFTFDEVRAIARELVKQADAAEKQAKDEQAKTEAEAKAKAEADATAQAVQAKHAKGTKRSKTSEASVH